MPEESRILEGHEVAMQKIQMFAEEHFDEYCLIVGKGKNIWSMYRNGTSAYGMLAKVQQEIYQTWTYGKK